MRIPLQTKLVGTEMAQDLQQIAYDIGYADYEQWATAQGYTLHDAYGMDTQYYASRGRLGAGVGVQRRSVLRAHAGPVAVMHGGAFLVRRARA